MSEAPGMEEWRRRAYLSAMGVTLWELRAPPGPAPSEPLAARPDPEPELVGDGPRVAPRSDAGTAQRNAVAGSGEATPPAPAPRVETEVDLLPGLATRTADTPRSEPPRSEPDAAGISAVHVERMDWDALKVAVAGCRACGLCETRTQTVFGVGNRDADLMIIGEAPGADEDRAGEPFVGRAGQLLNRMLAAIGLPREQVYIANVLKCRPPGNRDPKPEESLRCQGYLMRQMALIRPRVILALGRIAAQQLLKTDTSVGQLRGRWIDYGPDAIPLRVTYHPAYLLRSPAQKAKAWDDLTEVWRRLGDPPTR